MVRTLEFDLCEIALTTLAQARGLRQADHRVAGGDVARAPSWRAGLPARFTVARARRIWRASASACAPGRRPPASGCAASCTTSTASRPNSMTWVTEEDAHVAEFPIRRSCSASPPARTCARCCSSGEIDAEVGAGGARCPRRSARSFPTPLQPPPTGPADRRPSDQPCRRGEGRAAGRRIPGWRVELMRCSWLKRAQPRTGRTASRPTAPPSSC